jgi:hypothetical protein
MTDEAAADAEDALDVLVNQFADPLAFLRELVQNSIDAGSAEVEVRCDFTASENSARPRELTDETPGTLIIRVDDWGSGMDRATIDHRLTRLFSSDKEGDRTKIGQFGIGFVSVFALRPDGVCVDTGRAGENWRVLFRPDRSFTRLRLSEPVEGTKIQILKAVTCGESVALAQRVKQALRFYCRHVQIELRYAGELMSGPLTLAAPGQAADPTLIELAEQDPTMHVVVGFTPAQGVDLGTFYNRGLTLLEKPSELPGVSFKVDSPRFAHTLSRDAIIKDATYLAALTAVQRLAQGPLLVQLCTRLEAALTAGESEPRQLQEMLARGWPGRPLIDAWANRRCARTLQGELLTFTACLKAATLGKLFTTRLPLSAVQRLSTGGLLFLASWQNGLAHTLYGGQRSPAVEASPAYVLTRRTNDPEAVDPTGRFCPETLALLRRMGAAVLAVVLGHVDESIHAPPAVAQEHPFELSEESKTRLGPELLREPARTLVVNLENETVSSLLSLAENEPELAAYTLAKLCLGSALNAERDGQLLTVALERRCQRRGQ